MNPCRLAAFSAGLLISCTPAWSQWSSSGSLIYYNGGNVGIGTGTPQNRLHVVAGGAFEKAIVGRAGGMHGRAIVGEATGTSGVNVGIWGEMSGPSGFGVYGRAWSQTGLTYGVGGQSDSAGGVGVQGVAGAPSGATYGVHGLTASSDGTGVLGEAEAPSGNTVGVSGVSVSPSGTGVQGVASATTGSAWGVYGESASSTSAKGVYGATTAPTGNGWGVLGYSASRTGTGVYGFAGSYGGSGYTSYGVTGGTNNTWGYGVYSFGRTGASGTKSFRIDHPDDPGNRYLMHYSAESPEVLNIYSGTVTLDASGGARIALPDYFCKINRDPRYFLTPIGGPMPLLHVVGEMSVEAGSNEFHVAGGVPGLRISWEVKAVRNDAWVRAYGAPVSVEKTGPERGRYQHPELYGQPREMGLPGPAADSAHAPRRATPEGR